MTAFCDAYSSAYSEDKCAVTDCDNDTYARDLCNAHYTRDRRYGNPLGRPQPDIAAVERALAGETIHLRRVDIAHAVTLGTRRGMPAGDIALRIGISPRSVTRWRARLGVHPPATRAQIPQIGDRALEEAVTRAQIPQIGDRALDEAVTRYWRKRWGHLTHRGRIALIAAQPQPQEMAA